MPSVPSVGGFLSTTPQNEAPSSKSLPSSTNNESLLGGSTHDLPATRNPSLSDASLSSTLAVESDPKYKKNLKLYKYRNNQLGSYNDRVNALILYATLISAVITAFLVDFGKDLDSDSASATTVDPIHFAVFTLWMIALAASLCDLVMAIMSKMLLQRFESKLLDIKFVLIEQCFGGNSGANPDSMLERDNQFMGTVAPLELDLMELLHLRTVLSFFSKSSLQYSRISRIFILALRIVLILPPTITLWFLLFILCLVLSLVWAFLCCLFSNADDSSPFDFFCLILSSLKGRPTPFNFNLFSLLSSLNLIAVLIFFIGVVVRFAGTPIQTASIVIGVTLALSPLILAPYLVNQETLYEQGGTSSLRSI